MNPPRVALAAHRQIGLQALRLLRAQEIDPVAILVPDGAVADESIVDQLCRQVPTVATLRGTEFRSPSGIAKLASLDLDYLLSVHFPYLIPGEVLQLARIGALNLHPAYLPHNRGWHTPSWAILENTPYGATLHWMDEGMDTGDLALQRRVEVLPSDTADSLYARVLGLELEILDEAIPLLRAKSLPRIPQRGIGSAHRKSELNLVRQLHLHERTTVGELIRRLRGLTTNREDEAAWFESDGKRYLLQLKIREAESHETSAPRLRRTA